MDAQAWLSAATFALDELEGSPDMVNGPEFADLLRRVKALEKRKAWESSPTAGEAPHLLSAEKKAALETQKRRILEEIVATETFYVRCLDTLVKQYMQPLADSGYGEGGAIVPMEKIYKIFGNLEDIVLVNTELLAQLKTRIEDDKSDRVGDIFLNMSFALKIYSRYIGDYDASRQTINECEAIPRFASFLEATDARVGPNTNNNKMGSLMMMPVQRVPRYEMLLRELVRAKRKLGEEEWMEELEACMDAVKEVAEQNNERIRVTESKALLYDVQKRFSPKLCLVGPNEPTRLMLKEGGVRKAHARGGTQVACTLILLSDELLYATESKGRGGLLELHRRIDLAHPATAFDDKPNENGLDHAIVSQSCEKSSIFLCDDAQSKAAWLKALTDAQAKAREKAGVKTAAGGVAMTLWQQDTPHCAISKVRFTALNRRHHCRVNGECVSGDVSKARFDLKAGLGADRFGTSERVCDWCCRDHVIEGGDWASVIKKAKERRAAIAALKVNDAPAALAILADRLKDDNPPNAPVYGSWLWKKGGAGAADGKGRAGLFGRRNWKKRWCELRRCAGAFELLYFEEPGETGAENVKGRVALAGAKIRVVDPTLLSFVIVANNRDYPIRTLDHESPKDVTDADRGAFALWMAVLEECAGGADGAADDAPAAPAAAPAPAPAPKASKPPPPPPKREAPKPKAVADPALAKAEWYWQHNDGSQMGPSSFGDLEAALAAGALLGTCHIFAEDITADWVMLDDCARVKAALGLA